MERKKLLLSTEVCELGGLSCFKHTVGYLGRMIHEETALALVRFFWEISGQSRFPLVSFYVGDEERWQGIRPSAWRTLLERPERQREQTLKLHWVVGTATDVESLAAVYRFAWNYDWANEPVVVVVAPVGDSGEVLAGREEGPGLYPEEEHELLYSYSTVVTRYHDGLWLNVWSRSLDSDTILEQLRVAAGAGPIYFERIESTKWPPRQQAN